VDGAGRTGSRSSALASGYGSKLIHRAITGQLDGSIAYDWTKSGLLVVISWKESRLLR
jgi:hypothetical protein